MFTNSLPCHCTYLCFTIICGYYKLQTTSTVESYRYLLCHLSIFRRFAHYLCCRIYFSCSLHKQLNGDLKSITFVMLVVYKQVALGSSSQSETRLLLQVHEQFAKHLFVLHYCICGYQDMQTTSAVESYKHLINIQTLCTLPVFSYIKYIIDYTYIYLCVYICIHIYAYI